MAQAPISVWNEVRFTSDGISISLFSESAEGGAILEDEMWYTYDELQKMAPSEPLSLRLTEESRSALTGSRESAPVENLPAVGNLVEDSRPPSWSHDNRLKVVGISDKSADEYVIQESDFGREKTVYDANHGCEPDETVIEAEYVSGDSETYAFPLSRIEGI